ncbi:MAG: hypothetical protein FD142_3205, partial [bacterium]
MGSSGCGQGSGVGAGEAVHMDPLDKGPVKVLDA